MALTQPHIVVCGVSELQRTLRKMEREGRPVSNAITIRTYPKNSRLSGLKNFVPVQQSPETIPFNLSIITPESSFKALPPNHPDISPRLHLLLSCADVNDPNHKRAPNSSMLKEGFRFAQYHAFTRPEETLLVRCAFGLSRSTSLTLGIIAEFQKANQGTCDPQSCIDRVLEIRPRATLNLLMVRLIDEGLGLGGRFIQAVEDHPGIRENQKKSRLKQKIYTFIQTLVR